MCLCCTSKGNGKKQVTGIIIPKKTQRSALVNSEKDKFDTGKCGKRINA